MIRHINMDSISNIDNQLFHLLCNLDRENAPDVIEEMVACLDRETLDGNRQFIFADAKERYYEDLFAKGLQNEETLRLYQGDETATKPMQSLPAIL